MTAHAELHAAIAHLEEETEHEAHARRRVLAAQAHVDQLRTRAVVATANAAGITAAHAIPWANLYAEDDDGGGWWVLPDPWKNNPGDVLREAVQLARILGDTVVLHLGGSRSFDVHPPSRGETAESALRRYLSGEVAVDERREGRRG